MNCKKVQYVSKELAEAALRQLVADARRTGRGNKSWKRLNVYVCRYCQYFHVGRANHLPKPKIEQPKVPTPGELRRKEKHEAKIAERSANRKAKHIFEHLGFLVDVETAARRAKFAVDDLADSMAHAKRMAERFTFVK